MNLENKESNQVKNLVSDETIYEKHNSFQDFKVKDEKFESVLSRLKIFKEKVGEIKDQYRKDIVTKALDDIFYDGGNDGEIRFCLFPNTIEEIDRLEDQYLERYLFYRYRYEVFPRTFETDSYPPCLQVEPTSVCNFRCVFCYQTDQSFLEKKNGHMGNMSFEMFKKIIDEAEGEIEAITLASRGEPLVCKDIDKMLAYLEGKFLAVKMNTNASLLNEKKCHAILSSGIQTLVFSADAAEEPLYSKLRVNGNLDRVLKNVNLFNEIKAKHYPDSKLITRVSGVKVNKDQTMESMLGVWGELVDQVAFVDYNPWENTYERPLSGLEKPCSDLWRRAFVWFDGRVNPCDVDYKSELAVGNIASHSLKELWSEGPYVKMRDTHRSGGRNDLRPCDRCTVI